MDGVGIAGAVLEELDRVGVHGIFASHLHELLNFPLHLRRVRRKKMGVMYSNGNFDTCIMYVL